MANKILIKYPKNWGLSEKLVVELMEEILASRGFDNTEVSLLFVGSKRARDLNSQYRRQNYIPQVLGFPMNREVSSDGWLRLGDILICTPKLKYEVVFQKSSLKSILKNWLSHGLDNLLK